MACDSHNSRTNLIGSSQASKPIGIRLFGLCFRFDSLANKRTYHKVLVLAMTYLAYTAFHMGRRPLSIVKNVLNRNCTAHSAAGATIATTNLAALDENILYHDIDISQSSPLAANGSSSGTANSPPALNGNTTWCDWAPFDDDATANQLLALLDSAFLASYALSMFFSGMIAERMNLRHFITLGSCLSGMGLIAFGLAYPLDIHSMTYFVVIQIVCGAAQSIGWPVVVTCVSNWFEPDKLGTIYGFWNSHTNLGNILGATVAGFFVEKDWGLSFIVPGCMMIAVGMILFLFLVPTPQDVELTPLDSLGQGSSNSCRKSIGGLSGDDSLASHHEDRFSARSSDSKRGVECIDPTNEKAISFWRALRIPGVIEFSVCLFFSKLVSYTFLYWLPRYITSSTTNNSEHSAYLSTPFDVGGVVGAILAGWISDKYRANGITCNVMLLLAIPAMLAYEKLGSLSTMHNILLQLLAGALVNGPYCLITTAVSADLSQRVTDGKAMATVSAIIDGMGSVGAVLGPLFAGFVSNSGDWQAVFLMLILSDVFAALCLVRITISEIKQKLSDT